MPTPAVTLKALRAQLARSTLSINDLEEAQSYLLVTPAAGDTIVRRALLTAAVVAYARPFTKNEQSIAAQATATVAIKLSKVLNQVEISQHRLLLRLRHRAIAHSGSDLRPTMFKSAGRRSYIVGHHVFDLVTQDIDTQAFMSACEKLRSACLIAQARLNAKIHEAENAA